MLFNVIAMATARNSQLARHVEGFQREILLSGKSSTHLQLINVRW